MTNVANLVFGGGSPAANSAPSNPPAAPSVAVRDPWQLAPNPVPTAPPSITPANVFTTLSQTLQDLGNKISTATQSPQVRPASTGPLPVSEVARDRWLAAHAPSTPTNGGSVPTSPLSDAQAIAIAGRLHDAMYGDLVGTREKQVFEALDGLSAEAARQVAYQYEVKYNLERAEDASPQSFRLEGSLLYSRLAGELTPHGELDENAGDWARAQALLRGDAATADAIGLRTAANKAWPFRDGQEMLDVLRQATPAERQAIVEAFAKDYAQQPHLVNVGRGARVVPVAQTPEYSKDPATLLMNVLKTRLSGSEFTEAVGLIAAAKYKDSPSVVANSQGQAAVGRLYSLLDRPFPDGAGALEALKNLSPEERRYLQGQAPAQGPSKLEELLQNKLSAADFRQATAYLDGDPATAQATALYEALSRKVQGPRMGAVPSPDLAAAERILSSVETDAERRALLAALERQYNVSVGSLIPKNVSATNRDVLVALAQTQPEVLSAQASTLAGLPPEAARANLEFRADTLRRSTERLLGVDEAAVRQAFAGLTPEQARSLAGMPLDAAKPGWTLGDELTQWHRGGGGGRFTLELQQMLDGDAAATGNLAAQIDEAQAQYTLETTGPLIGVNDAIQRLFGNDARAVLDADAARLQAAEAALGGSPSAVPPARADMAVAYMDTGLHDYRTAKEATTEAAKTVVTTVAVVGTTVATAGTAAAVWAPIAAGATANLAATQLNGASNSWQDDAIAVTEGAANGVNFLPGAAVTVRGGQYLVREAVEEGGQQVFRSVSRSLAQEAVERGLAEGAEEVLARGGQVILRDAGRELTVQAFRPTLAQAVGLNVAEGVGGSLAGDLSAGLLRGELDPQQMAANAVLAASTAGLLGLGMAGASRLTQTRSPGLAQDPVPASAPARDFLTRGERGTIGRAAQFGDTAAQKILIEDYIARHPELGAETAALLRNPPPHELSGLTGHDAVLASMITGNTSLGRSWYAWTRGVMKDTVSPLTHVAMKVHAAGAVPEEVQRILGLGMRLAQPTEGRAGVRYMRAQYLEDLEEADRLISAHQPDQVDLLRRINAVLDEGRTSPPTPPPEAANTTMQAAFVRAMRRTHVAEIGIRGSDAESRVWHFVGGSTVHDAQGRVMGPSAPPQFEPQIVDGRPVFPLQPKPSTGAIFPTKPGGLFPWTEGAPAVTLGPDEVVSLNAARAARGLPPLHEAYPDLPIPRLVMPPLGGEPVWVQQLSLGGARPVVAEPVRDAAGKLVDGRVLMAVTDVDIVYVRTVDGRLLTDAEIMAPNGLKAAINRAYAELASPGSEYEIVNHGAHFNALQDPELVEAYRLDAQKYWDGSVHTFTLDAGGYTRTASFGETYGKLVDPTYVPTWQRGTAGR